MNRNIFFLYQLCRAMKPGTRRVNISTTLYGESLGMSQQSASRHLKELEDEGFVRRMKTGRGMDITLTPEDRLLVRGKCFYTYDASGRCNSYTLEFVRGDFPLAK